jgi:hypothetical protein
LAGNLKRIRSGQSIRSVLMTKIDSGAHTTWWMFFARLRGPPPLHTCTSLALNMTVGIHSNQLAVDRTISPDFDHDEISHNVHGARKNLLATPPIRNEAGYEPMLSDMSPRRQYSIRVETAWKHALKCCAGTWHGGGSCYQHGVGMRHLEAPCLRRKPDCETPFHTTHALVTI